MSASRQTDAQALADTIMLAQFTPANVRAWMIATPFTMCPAWNDYVNHMIASICGDALVREIAKSAEGASGESK